MMQPRGKHRRDSGVTEFEIRDKSIVVAFRAGHAYVYTYENPGRQHAKTMKRLATLGRGLSTYISQKVKGGYAEKFVLK